MSGKSAIEWTEMTWNPVTGCDWVSPGCDHCYARTLARRLKAMGNPRYQHDGYDRALQIVTPGFGVRVHPDKLDEPLQRKQPTMYFVNSMSDLFHEEVPNDFIARTFDVMGAATQHTFQVLTKRPRRMSLVVAQYYDRVERSPFPNVWLGTSVENQRWANQRIPLLLETPAAVRFLSCEPLLGPMDISDHLERFAPSAVDYGRGFNRTRVGSLVRAIDWVIVGGESGQQARPMRPEWATGLRDQCEAAGVAFFFKQWGGRTPKAGGRQLEGRTHDQMPTTPLAAAASV